MEESNHTSILLQDTGYIAEEAEWRGVGSVMCVQFTLNGNRRQEAPKTQEALKTAPRLKKLTPGV